MLSFARAKRGRANRHWTDPNPRSSKHPEASRPNLQTHRLGFRPCRSRRRASVVPRRRLHRPTMGTLRTPRTGGGGPAATGTVRTRVSSGSSRSWRSGSSATWARPPTWSMTATRFSTTGSPSTSSSTAPAFRPGSTGNLSELTP